MWSGITWSYVWAAKPKFDFFTPPIDHKPPISGKLVKVWTCINYLVYQLLTEKQSYSFLKPRPKLVFCFLVLHWFRHHAHCQILSFSPTRLFLYIFVVEGESILFSRSIRETILFSESIHVAILSSRLSVRTSCSVGRSMRPSCSVDCLWGHLVQSVNP